MTGELSVLKGLDFEALTDSDPTYMFTVEALDTDGTMPPGLASVTVRIMVSVDFFVKNKDKLACYLCDCMKSILHGLCAFTCRFSEETVRSLNLRGSGQRHVSQSSLPNQNNQTGHLL